MRARIELQKLFGEYQAMVGRTNPEAAASLTLAHCILEIVNKLNQGEENGKSEAKTEGLPLGPQE